MVWGNKSRQIIENLLVNQFYVLIQEFICFIIRKKVKKERKKVFDFFTGNGEKKRSPLWPMHENMADFSLLYNFDDLLTPYEAFVKRNGVVFPFALWFLWLFMFFFSPFAHISCIWNLFQQQTGKNKQKNWNSMKKIKPLKMKGFFVLFYFIFWLFYRVALPQAVKCVKWKLCNLNFTVWN